MLFKRFVFIDSKKIIVMSGIESLKLFIARSKERTMETIVEFNPEKCFIISDLHFKDDHILKYRPQFKNIEEHDAMIVNRWNETISDDDIVFVLGDVARSAEGASVLKELPGKKVLILGNWDAPPKVWLQNGYDEVHAMLRLWMYSGEKQLFRTICTHTPIEHDLCIWGQNFHGHIHDDRGVYKKHINVCVGLHGYAPRKIADLMSRFVDEQYPITSIRMVTA